jgi:hypothetical protein
LQFGFWQGTFCVPAVSDLRPIESLLKILPGILKGASQAVDELLNISLTPYSLMTQRNFGRLSAILAVTQRVEALWVGFKLLNKLVVSGPLTRQVRVL